MSSILVPIRKADTFHRRTGWFAAACLACLAMQPDASALDMTSSAGAGRVSAQAPRLPPRGWSSSRRIRLAGPYPARVLGVIDGDTFVARIPVWIGQEVTTHVRLRGIDAPELKSRCAAEARLASEARQALQEILASGRIVLRDVGTGKFAGRVLARVYVTSRFDRNTDEAGAMLLAAGYARPYGGGRRGDWCRKGLAKR